MRNLDPAELAQYAGGHFHEAIFAELQFVSGTLYLHDGDGTYTWGGHEWLGLGELGGISEIDESSDLGVRGFTLTLSGVQPALLATAMDRTDYKGRPVVLYVGVLDEDAQLVATPKVLARGTMDVASIERNAKSGTIHLRCERESIRLLRKITARFSDQDHQLRFPGDKIFSLAAGLQNKDVTWGGQRITPGFGGGGSGGERYNDPIWGGDRRHH